MPDVFDINPLDKFMALFTGHNGSGKSVAIGSFLEDGPIYIFDFDGRQAAVSNWYKQRGLKPGQLEYDTYGPSNLYAAYKKLYDLTNNCPYAAISIDSFTAATVSAVMYSLRERASKTGKDLPAMSKGNMIIPDWDEYKAETVFITTMLDLCKELASKKVKVFWTAHPITSTKITKAQGAGDRDSYSTQTRYAAYGQKSDSLIPIYFNEIYHFTTDWDFSRSRDRRICLTRPRGDINAKTALNLPPEFDWTGWDENSPSFYQILKELAKKGKGEEKNDVKSDEEPPKKNDWF